MDKMSALLVAAGLLLVGVYECQGQGIQSCALFPSCFSIREEACNSEGKRAVCLLWTNTFCDAATIFPTTGVLPRACRQSNGFSDMEIMQGVLFCDTDNLTPGGAQYSFGVVSRFQSTNTANGVISLGGRSVTCTGNQAVCGTAVQDFRLTFTTSPCNTTAATTTTAAPITTPTTVAPPADCNCGAYQSGTCSHTCGVGIETQSRTCVGNCGNTPLTRTVACKVQECPQPTNGNWGQWGQWGACSKTCRGGNRRRSRLCDSPAPSAGGNPCFGASSETERCGSGGCRGGGGGGCRRRARNNECRNARRVRQCVRRVCGRRG